MSKADASEQHSSAENFAEVPQEFPNYSRKLDSVEDDIDLWLKKVSSMLCHIQSMNLCKFCSSIIV